MLTDEEKREIDAELHAYPQKSALAPDALKIIQRHRGWVSDESLKDVAAHLDMTPDELDGVATFYNLVFRQPVGKHVILICDSVTCWIMGYDNLREHLFKRLSISKLGETTADGKITVLPIVCLGVCDHAPAMMVDDRLYGDLTLEKIDEILAQYTQD